MTPEIHSFDDLLGNYATAYQIKVAIDITHADQSVLADFWPHTGDDQFRRPVRAAACGFWDGAIRKALKADTPETWFAVEGIFDSYADSELGYTLYLELHAYCGSESIGNRAWSVLEDDARETAFVEQLHEAVVRQVRVFAPGDDLNVNIEVTEICED